MVKHRSHVAVPTQASTLMAEVVAQLLAAQWRTLPLESAEGSAAATPDLIMIDGTDPLANAAIANLRRADHPWRGTPLVQVQNGNASRMGGVNALIGTDADIPLAIEQWTGRLDDHGFRATPWSPTYRLVRLLGAETARGMLGRLAQALADLLDSARTTPLDREEAHKMAGLSGMMGYATLSEAWSTVEEGGDAAPALALSLTTLQQLRAVDRTI
ncbi:MAG: hypothetical protein U5M50_06505 [Sphingobium sp.]|nr:hypothetical protein [Sphingobium sp.]